MIKLEYKNVFDKWVSRLYVNEDRKDAKLQVLNYKKMGYRTARLVKIKESGYCVQWVAKDGSIWKEVHTDIMTASYWMKEATLMGLNPFIIEVR